ncbi:MAG: hypothetical protein IPL65_14280 [Lewinellaceae bacterium]|nr:hypothetical protein [Lewinellaceae bacterium]
MINRRYSIVEIRSKSNQAFLGTGIIVKHNKIIAVLHSNYLELSVNLAFKPEDGLATKIDGTITYHKNNLYLIETNFSIHENAIPMEFVLPQSIGKVEISGFEKKEELLNGSFTIGGRITRVGENMETLEGLGDQAISSALVGAIVWEAGTTDERAIGLIQEVSVGKNQFLIWCKPKIDEFIKSAIGKTNYEDDFTEKIESKTVRIRRSSLPIFLRETESNIPENPNFEGREREIEEVITKVLESKAVGILGLKGTGGVGKSALAAEVCKIFKKSWYTNPDYPNYLKSKLGESSYFTDGVLWIRFESDLNLNQHLSQVVRQLGYEWKTENNDENLLWLQEILRDKDVLIVLDSAEQSVLATGPGQESIFSKFFQHLRKTGKAIIVTSRIALGSDIEVVDIKSLSPEASYDLFVKYLKRVPEAKETVLVKSICQKVGYLPLAIKILASKTRRYGLSLDIIIEQLNSPDFKELYKMTNIIDPSANEDAFASFMMSYDVLDIPQKMMLNRCSMLREAFDFYTAASLNKSTLPIASQTMALLYDVSLLEKEDGRYRLHPLIRTFTSHLFVLNEGEEAVNETLEIKKDIYLEKIKTGFSELDIKEIKIVFKYLIDKEAVQEYFSVLHPFYEEMFDKGYWAELAEVLENAIEEGIKYKKDEESFSLHLNFIDLLARQGDYVRSIRLLDETLKYPQITESIYFTLNYVKGTNLFRLKQFESSVSQNKEFIRQTHLFNNYQQSFSFIKTLGWVYKDFTRERFAADALLSNFLDEKFHGKKYVRNNFIFSVFDLVEFLQEEQPQVSLDVSEKLKKLLAENIAAEQKRIFISNLIDCHIKLSNFDEFEKQLLIYENQLPKFGLLSSLDILFEYRAILLILKGEFENAEYNLNRIIEDNDAKKIWKIRLLIKKGETEKAKKQIVKTLEYYHSKGRVLEWANTLLELAKIEANLNKEFVALKILKLAQKKL